MSKVCSKCGELKSLDSFYRRNGRKDGHKSSCKSCDKIYAQKPDVKASHLAASNRYAKTSKGKESSKRGCAKFRKTEAFKHSIQKYRNNNPERRSAQIALSNAIATGKIIRPECCSVCMAICIPEGHHFDYAKQLDVIWVCKKCHTDYHWSKT